MTVDPRRILHFLAVARLGTISKAARELRVSQPALSNSIAELERSLGATLLERSRRGVTLTEAGRLLSRRAEALDGFLTAASDELSRHARGLSGKLTIGVSPVAAVTAVPSAVARLATEFPEAAIDVIELPDDQLLDGLLKGGLNIAVSPAGTHRPQKAIVSERLFSDRFVVATSKSSALARRRSLGLDQISGLPFVMPRSGTAMHRHLEAMFISANVAWPKHSISTNSLLMIKRLISAGDAITIISDRLVEAEVAAGTIATVRLRDARSGREVSMWRLRDAPPQVLLDRFMAHLRT